MMRSIKIINRTRVEQGPHYIVTLYVNDTFVMKSILYTLVGINLDEAIRDFIDNGFTEFFAQRSVTRQQWMREKEDDK